MEPINLYQTLTEITINTSFRTYWLKIRPQTPYHQQNPEFPNCLNIILSVERLKLNFMKINSIYRFSINIITDYHASVFTRIAIKTNSPATTTTTGRNYLHKFNNYYLLIITLVYFAYDLFLLWLFSFQWVGTVCLLWRA